MGGGRCFLAFSRTTKRKSFRPRTGWPTNRVLPIKATIIFAPRALVTTTARKRTHGFWRERKILRPSSLVSIRSDRSPGFGAKKKMQRNNSFGTSWADQWDYGSDPSPRGRQQDGAGKKQGGVEKTKAAAATGLRKVKEGTATGFQWIKDKCQKKNSGGGKKREGSGVVGY